MNMSEIRLHALERVPRSPSMSDTTDTKVESFRERRKTVLKLLKDGQPETMDPSLRQALDETFKGLYTEKRSVTEKLIDSLRTELRVTTERLIRALVVDELARATSIQCAFEDVSRNVTHQQRDRSRRGQDIDEAEIEIKALDDALGKQRGLLRWVEQAKDLPTDGAV
jgi:hypothetical protein